MSDPVFQVTALTPAMESDPKDHKNDFLISTPNIGTVKYSGPYFCCTATVSVSNLPLNDPWEIGFVQIIEANKNHFYYGDDFYGAWEFAVPALDNPKDANSNWYSENAPTPGKSAAGDRAVPLGMQSSSKGKEVVTASAPNAPAVNIHVAMNDNLGTSMDLKAKNLPAVFLTKVDRDMIFGLYLVAQRQADPKHIKTLAKVSWQGSFVLNFQASSAACTLMSAVNASSILSNTFTSKATVPDLKLDSVKPTANDTKTPNFYHRVNGQFTKI